jgi:hypothetical protein
VSVCRCLAKSVYAMHNGGDFVHCKIASQDCHASPGQIQVPVSIKNKVFASFENEYGDHCVDIFERPNGSFGFEEFRRDAEDCGAWQSLARYAQQVFDSRTRTCVAADQSVHWLAQSDIWKRYLAS